MKKILLFLFFALFSTNTSASEAEDWQYIYDAVQTAYIDRIDISTLATSALKGLNRIDSALTVADDNTRITLYYRGKVIKVLNKPDENTALKWGQLTAQIIDSATQHSSQADRDSFKITDALSQAMLKVLDDDSSFYPNIDEANQLQKRFTRQWSSRLLDDNTLYVKILSFNKQTSNQMIETINEYPHISKMIIDLRDCRGGMAGEAIKTADIFLSEGIIVSTFIPKTSEQIYYNADKNELFTNKDIEIWVGPQTASAAEILAASLQEQSRALIKGEKTFGKGSMQKLIILPSQSVLAITNGFFQTPSGQSWHKTGIIPNQPELSFPEI